MSKKLIILGNGFSKDLLVHLRKDSIINVGNLFRNGDKVPWPGDNNAGFLSYKHCPNLWNLGARPNIDDNTAIELIEDIITCANIFQKNNREENNIYIKAYKELASYLYSLFSYYDNLIVFKKITKQLNSWSWAKYLKNLSDDPKIDKVYILTYNYDVWLEKVLIKKSIPFDISGFEDNDRKFNIFKPHGSISFIHNVKKVKDDFKIDYDTDSNDGNISEFKIGYDEIDSLNKINAIIPPAGDSSRLDFKWAMEIREKAKIVVKDLKEEDELIFCGISYWHVDRYEIDSILTKISPKISNVKVFNPNPPRVLNAVMTTLYKNVIFYTDSECINL
jgi:hypothetical protein